MHDESLEGDMDDGTKRGVKRARTDGVLYSPSSSQCGRTTTNTTTSASSTSSNDANGGEFLAAEGGAQELQRANAELREQLKEAKKRESELVVRLTRKERDIFNLEAYIKELMESSEKKMLQMRTTFMDPLVNENFQRLQDQIAEYEKKLVTAQEDLKAVQFDANNNSYMGKQLIAKCRRLQEENEEHGKELAQSDSGRMSAQLKLQKHDIDRLNLQLAEEWEFELELGEELTKLQEKIFLLEKENEELRGTTGASANPGTPRDGDEVSQSGDAPETAGGEGGSGQIETVV